MRLATLYNLGTAFVFLAGFSGVFLGGLAGLAQTNSLADVGALVAITYGAIAVGGGAALGFRWSNQKMMEEETRRITQTPPGLFDPYQYTASRLFAPPQDMTPDGEGTSFVCLDCGKEFLADARISGWHECPECSKHAARPATPATAAEMTRRENRAAERTARHD